MITRDQKLLIDFGSTFTKVVVVDLKQECIVARSQAISTVSVDASLGLKSALQIALGETVETVDATQYIASSSAAGGLRMICSGFVPELSSEAAARVALGAGAKVVHTFSHKLTKSEIETISKLNPDIILLCGGTDGGNSAVLLHNAKAIASSKHLIGSVLIAGNKDAHDEIDGIFALAEKPKAKGIREDVLMPTPLAVLNAAKLLAEGIPGESGLGELAIVDVGGSTTDVVSIADQRPLSPNTIVRGLPEPYAKRTVEGDLGVRFSLDKITEMAARGTGTVDDDFIRYCNFVSNSARLPSNDIERAFDSQLATQAAKEAFERHVGRIEVLHTFSGEIACQYGKNLTGIKNVIGTGGPIVFSHDARKILEVVSYDSNFPLLLKPKRPRFWVDQYYILYAMGLLAVSFPEAAFRIMKNCLKQV
jgi:hypothetical protein